MAGKHIVLMSNFGLADPYVGIVKGVISQIAPDLKLIDLSHHIPPGDIQTGALQLWQSTDYFPPGTVFLTVVDPGVGTARKGICLQRGNQIFIGPDNGLFTYLGYKTAFTAWELTNLNFQLPHPSHTFHGRNIFAPAAARAALGTLGKEFGERVSSLVHLPRPICQVAKSNLKDEVLGKDRFGNLITSRGKFQPIEQGLVLASWTEDASLIIPSKPTIQTQHTEKNLALVPPFADIPAQGFSGVIGSSGLLEIAAKQASAADQLGLSRGQQITLTWDQ